MSAVSVTAANVIPSSRAVLEQGVCGATTATAGQSMYKDASGLWQLADANGTTPSNSMGGIAACGSSVNQPILIAKNDPNFTPGFTALAGDTIWLSPTAGGLTKTIGDLVSGCTVIVAGVMITTTTMNLNITTGGAVA